MAATQSQLFCFNTFAQTPINWQMNQAQALAAQLSPLCTPTPYIHPAQPIHPTPCISRCQLPFFFGAGDKTAPQKGKSCGRECSPWQQSINSIQRQTHWPAHASGKSIKCTFILFSRRRDTEIPTACPFKYININLRRT